MPPLKGLAAVEVGNSRTKTRLPLDAALGYAVRGWQMFLCLWRGERRKRPLTEHGFKDVSRDPTPLGTLCVPRESAL